MPQLSIQIPRQKGAPGRPPAATDRLPEMLQLVSLKHDALRQAYVELDVAMLRARSHGASWRDLALVVDLTHQAVRRRYVS